MSPCVSRLLAARCALAALLVLGVVRLQATGLPAGFHAIDESEYHAASVDPHEPGLHINYPGSATNKGIAEGWAIVSVAVDAQGHGTDFLLVGCSDEIFGRTLIEWVKPLKFQPAHYRGVAVPGSCEVGYRFEYRTPSSSEHNFGFSAWGFTTGGLQVGAPLSVGLLDAFSGKNLKQKPAYAPVAEKGLDQPLEYTDLALPRLPAGYAAPAGRLVKVWVSFYIDETGRTRMPRIESAVAPELVAGALKAVHQWSFKPPLAHGKPALVLTARSVGFLPRTD